MSLKHALAIGASGLTAQRVRMEVVASNLTNAQATRTADGGPYRRMQPLFVATPVEVGGTADASQRLQSVRVAGVLDDPTPFVERYEPGHPDADERGIVAYPNVEPAKEMVDLLSATRSYEAQVTLIQGVRDMLKSALQILA